jgi:hypothetical protein
VKIPPLIRVPLAVFAILAVMAFLARRQGPPVPQPAVTLSVGERGHLHGDGSSEQLVAADWHTFQAMVQAANTGNTSSQTELTSTGRVWLVPHGTPVQVLAVNGDAAQVRILSGELAGKSGWTAMAFVSP